MSKDITKEDLLSILDKYLYGWALGDIKRASIEGTAKLAGFILGACFVDSMASFHAGVINKDGKYIDRHGKNNYRQNKIFKKFVTKYLKDYVPSDFYQAMRCSMVHAYTEGGKYVFTDASKAGEHLEQKLYGNQVKILLNLEDFVADLEKAYFSLIEDIKGNSDIFENAKFVYKSRGILGEVFERKPIKESSVGGSIIQSHNSVRDYVSTTGCIEHLSFTFKSNYPEPSGCNKCYSLPASGTVDPDELKNYLSTQSGCDSRGIIEFKDDSSSPTGDNDFYKFIRKLNNKGEEDK